MESERSVESSQPEKLVRKSVAAIIAYSKSPQASENAARAKAFGPEPTALDLEEIPAISEEQWATAAPLNQVLTVRVDADVSQWFRSKRNADRQINRILRRVMERAQARVNSRH